jgi:hypothetical protein
MTPMVYEGHSDFSVFRYGLVATAALERGGRYEYLTLNKTVKWTRRRIERRWARRTNRSDEIGTTRGNALLVRRFLLWYFSVFSWRQFAVGPRGVGARAGA